MTLTRRAGLQRYLRPPALPERVWQTQTIGSMEGRSDLPDRASFDAFAARDDVPGAMGVREVKFLVTDAHTDRPQIHFMNSVRNPLHFYFASDHLGFAGDLADFNRKTYFSDQRQFIAGFIIAHDNYTRPDGSPGLYALEFWPTDPVSVIHVAKAYHLALGAMGFAADTLAYHPSGDVQEQRFIREADSYAAQSVRTISTGEIFEGITYSPLHLGTATGLLRVINSNDVRPPSATDIVIYDTLPNDLPLVAGVITSAPQTPLSHVNLRAQQNNTPNAYLRNAAQNPELAQFIGQPVRLTVKPDGIEVAPVTMAALTVALDARRPARGQTPARNLGPRRIVALDDLAFTDVDGFGAKATNLAELRRVIDPQYVPNGFAVPFSYYHDFMVANDLYGMIRSAMERPDFADDARRRDMLKTIRRAIKNAPLLTPQRDQLDAMHKSFPPGTTPRCRSSANNEDLVGFTGAGLYDSYTHRLDEGHIEKSIKQVWASLWNLRAYNERDFYRIDHMTAAMGVLVHPNFDDERVNGVALTRNFYFPAFEGYFVNAQVGEDMVTNPDGRATAEEVLVIQNIDAGNPQDYETVYIRRSSLVGDDQTVLSTGDLMLLTAQMKKIQTHFAQLYGRSNDDTFAMDIEFKIDRNGLLAIKQARPWTG